LDSGEISKKETLPFCRNREKFEVSSNASLCPFSRLPPSISLPLAHLFPFLSSEVEYTYLIPSNQVPSPQIHLEPHPLIRSLPILSLRSCKRLQRFLRKPDIEGLNQTRRPAGGRVEDGGIVRVEFELGKRSDEAKREGGRLGTREEIRRGKRIEQVVHTEVTPAPSNPLKVKTCFAPVFSV